MKKQKKVPKAREKGMVLMHRKYYLNEYELKKLTRKGYEYAERNYFAHDGFLHSTLMNFNFYSALPRFSRYA